MCISVKQVSTLFISPLAYSRQQIEGSGTDRGDIRSVLKNQLVVRRMVPLEVDPLEGFPELSMDMDLDSDMEDPTAGDPITEDDIEEINQLLKDVKQGKLGPVWRKELLEVEDLYLRRQEAISKMPGGSDDEPKIDVNELINEKHEELDATLKEVFDISNLSHPTEEEIAQSLDNFNREEDKGLLEPKSVKSPNDEEYEKYFREVSERKLEPSELKKMVHGYYRHKGLLNEPVVTTMFDRFELKWKQHKRTLDIWFKLVSPDDQKDDYDVRFMPKELTIVYKGKAASRGLRGKVDVDGCFWSIQDDPKQGRVIRIVLLKRAPLYMNTWEHLFLGNTPSQL